MWIKKIEFFFILLILLFDDEEDVSVEIDPETGIILVEIEPIGHQMIMT